MGCTNAPESPSQRRSSLTICPRELNHGVLPPVTVKPAVALVAAPPGHRRHASASAPTTEMGSPWTRSSAPSIAREYAARASDSLGNGRARANRRITARYADGKCSANCARVGMHAAVSPPADGSTTLTTALAPKPSAQVTLCVAHSPMRPVYSKRPAPSGWRRQQQ